MKRLAMIAGVVLLIAGVAGYVPQLCPDGKLFGLFAVDPMHNIVHIVTGLMGVGMSLASEAAGRNFFRILGVLYALVAALGFIVGRDGQVLGMAMNMADHFLHAGIAIVGLWLGFAYHAALPPSRGHGPDLRGA